MCIRDSACSIHFHVLAGLHWFRDQHVQTGNGTAQTDEQEHIREINADGDGGRSEGKVRQNIEYNAEMCIRDRINVLFLGYFMSDILCR